MGHWRYLFHGLDVISNVVLPEWEPFERKVWSGESQVTISVITECVDYERASVPEDGYRFFVDEIGWFRVRGGREIAAWPLPRAAIRRVRVFLLGSAWGALLYQRKRLIIHASAVQIGDGAVAFCAGRGEGKSTLAALLGECGHRSVSDDLCCLSLEGSAPMIYPSMPRARLWRDAIEVLGWGRSGSEPDSVRPGKFQYARQGSAPVDPLPLRGLYILAWGHAGINRLTGFAALTRFVSAAQWRSDLLMTVGNPADHMQQCADLLRQVPLSEFRRPRDLPTARENVKILTNSWICQ